jgi:thymidine kinase
MKKGKLVAIAGPMFAGKTTELIRIYGEGEGVVVFKPDLDKRYTKQPLVVSHDRVEIPSVLVNNDKPEEMLELIGETKTVLVDEVNFFTPSIVQVIEQLLTKGVDVYVAGLDRFADGGVWEPMAGLIKKADQVVMLTARCDGMEGECKAPATRSYFKAPNMDKITVAGADQYGAACEQHYVELHHKGKQD